MVCGSECGGSVWVSGVGRGFGCQGIMGGATGTLGGHARVGFGGRKGLFPSRELQGVATVGVAGEGEGEGGGRASREGAIKSNTSGHSSTEVLLRSIILAIAGV